MWFLWNLDEFIYNLGRFKKKDASTCKTYIF